MHENCYHQQTKITHSTASDMKKTWIQKSFYPNIFSKMLFGIQTFISHAISRRISN